MLKKWLTYQFKIGVTFIGLVLVLFVVGIGRSYSTATRNDDEVEVSMQEDDGDQAGESIWQFLTGRSANAEDRFHGITGQHLKRFLFIHAKKNKKHFLRTAGLETGNQATYYLCCGVASLSGFARDGIARPFYYTHLHRCTLF